MAHEYAKLRMSQAIHTLPESTWPCVLMFESSVRNEPHGRVKKTLKPSLPEAMTKLTHTKPIQFKTKNELARELENMRHNFMSSMHS
jgi:hypothetical protein